MSRLRRFFELPAAERSLFFKAWWVLLTADVGLRLMSLPKLRRLLIPKAPSSAESPSLSILPVLEGAVDRAANHHLYPMTCLRRSLCLERLLRQNGFPAELQIGVRREEGVLAAHAWVEVGGEPLGDSEQIAERYLPLARRRQDS